MAGLVPAICICGGRLLRGGLGHDLRPFLAAIGLAALPAIDVEFHLGRLLRRHRQVVGRDDRIGALLGEIDGVSEQIARESLALAAGKLPIKTKFIVRRDLVTA